MVTCRPGDKDIGELATKLHISKQLANVLFFILFFGSVAIGSVLLIQGDDYWKRYGAVISKSHGNWSGIFVVLICMTASYFFLTGIVALVIVIFKE